LATPLEILNRRVKLFNEGLRKGNFTPMVSHFSEDAEMYFEGIPVGPFKGRAAIELDYSEQPPDDEIVSLEGGIVYRRPQTLQLRRPGLRR
jgi:hypothetical protein